MKAVCLLRYPQGAPEPGDFELRDLPDPVAGEGDVLVQVTHLSLDPLPRVRMQEKPAMGAPMQLDAPVEGRGIGRVLHSNNEGFSQGDLVTGELGWQSLTAKAAEQLTRVEGDAAPRHHLNALGATGLAAWFLVEALDPKPDESALVAPAAGAVGSLVCQIAKAREPDLKILGTAMSKRQADFLDGLGVESMAPDADWPGPDGIDLFVDGVGGGFHDRMLSALNPRARVVLLGFVSAYGDDTPPHYGNAAAILLKRARMEGFLLADHMARANEAREGIARLIEDGSLEPAETVHHGLASAPEAFAALFADSPPGKQIVELEDFL